MLGDGPSRSKRPRITDDDEWSEELFDEAVQTGRESVCYKCCLSPASNRHGKDISGGYLEAGFAERLLSGNELAFPQCDQGRRILGLYLSSCTSLSQQLVPAFSLARRMSDILVAPESIRVEWLKLNAAAGDISTLRNQASDFLQLVCSCVERLSIDPGQDSSGWPMTLVSSIYQQLSAMGMHIRQHVRDVFSGAKPALSLSRCDQDLGCPLCFHLWLDVGWTLLAFLVTLCKFRIGGYLPHPPQHLLSQQCRSQAVDFLGMHFATLEAAWPEVQCADLLPCTCVKEAWVTLRQFMDWSSEQHQDGLSFWSMLNTILGGFLVPVADGSTCEPQLRDLRDRCNTIQRRSFCWILVGFFSKLYDIDRMGRVVQRPGQTFANWLFVLDLLRQSLDKEATGVSSSDRVYTRTMLLSLLPLAEAWPASQDALQLLWDIMHRFLNAGGTQQASHSWLSVSKWTQQCTKAAEQSNDSELPDNNFLWWLFLRILSIELTKPQAGAPNTMWLRVKGRFLSRFNRRRMQELSWCGLENFCSLFLVLALCTEMPDIVSKMLPLLDTIPHEDENRQIVCWRGLLAAHALGEQRQTDVLAIQKSLAGRFAGLLKSCVASGSADQYAVLAYVLDSIEDMHGCGLLQGCLHRFVLTEWTAVFAEAKRRERECCRLLEAAVWLVDVVRSGVHFGSEDSEQQSEDGHSSLCAALWHIVFPSLRQLSSQYLSHRLLQQVSDVCMVFAQLSYLLPSAAADSHTFQSIVQHFGLSADVVTGIRLRFLSHIMSDNDTRHLLLSDSVSPVGMLFQCWIGAVISSGSVATADPHTRDSLMDFTRSMEKLPEIKQILDRPEPSGLPDPVDMTSQSMWEISLLAFIRRLGIAFRYGTAEERIQLRDRANGYFGRFLQLAEGYLSSELDKASPELKCTYRVAAAIVQWCSVLLYSRTAHRCLLPQLLDKLVLPLSTKKKPVPTMIDTYIRRHVYQFIFGVACLDFMRDDFARRKLREIFQRNLLVPTKSLSSYGGITSSHPYLTVLTSLSRVIKDSDVKALRQLLLTSLRDSYFALPTKQPNMLLATVSLISIMHQSSTRDVVFSDCQTVLRHLLLCLLACELGRAGGDVRTIKSPLEALVKSIFVKAEAAPQAERQAIVQLVTKYSSDQLGLQKHAVFKPLIAIAPCCPSLMAEYCVYAEGLVQRYEVTQGKGNDLLMRNALQQLEKAVQRGASVT